MNKKRQIDLVTTGEKLADNLGVATALGSIFGGITVMAAAGVSNLVLLGLGLIFVGTPVLSLLAYSAGLKFGAVLKKAAADLQDQNKFFFASLETLSIKVNNALDHLIGQQLEDIARSSQRDKIFNECPDVKNLFTQAAIAKLQPIVPPQTTAHIALKL